MGLRAVTLRAPSRRLVWRAAVGTACVPGDFVPAACHLSCGFKALYGFAHDVAVSPVDAIPVFGSCRAGGRRFEVAWAAWDVVVSGAQLSESLPRALRWRL